MRISRPAAWSRLILVLLALFAVACGDDDDDREGSVQPQGDELQVTLGTKNFTEAFIVGELYRQALEFRGINVDLVKDIGPTEVIDKELQSGRIDGYPEYLGVAVTVAAGQEDAGSTAKETYELAKEFYAGRGQAISEQTSFENVDAIATTQYFAQRRGLATVGDLQQLSSFSLGARPEFETRQQGLAVSRARPQRDRCRQRVHHRWSAGERELQGARGRQARVRLPARRARDRRGQAR
jgi:osmoprotectant transport system substrate-binding protein